MYYPFGAALPQPTPLPVFNVMVFGATGNGSTDDTVAIQSAINAANAAGGGIVYFPIGLYAVSATAGNPALIIPGNNITLQGAGSRGSVLFLLASSPVNAFILQAFNVSYVNIYDMEIKGNGVSPGAGVLYFPLVNFSGGSFCIFRNVYFYRSPSGMLGFNGNSYMWVEDCTFDTSGYNATAAYFAPMLNTGQVLHSDHIFIRNCAFENALFHSIWLTSSDSLVDGCSFYECGEARIVAGDNRITITNNDDYNGYVVSSSGFMVEAFVDDIIVTNNKIFNAGNFAGRFALNPNACGGLFIAGGNAIITGNIVVNCSASGILPASDVISSYNPLSGQNVVVSNNTVIGCGTLPSSSVGSQEFGGILFTGSYTNLVVAGNACSGNGGVGDIINYSAVTKGTYAVSGNSCFPDTLQAQGSNLTGTTAWTLFESIPVARGAMGENGGFKASAQGVFALSSATAQLMCGWGGATMIVLSGTFLVGETLTYTLNGHSVVYTVITGSTSLAAIAAGLVAAIAADGTDGPLVTPTVTTTQSHYDTGNVATANILIQAQSAAFQLAATLATSVSTTSAGGSVVQDAGDLIYTTIAYTTGAAPLTAVYRLDMEALVGVLPQIDTMSAQLWVGTTLVSSTKAPAAIDTSLAQSISVYGKLGNAGDAIDYNSLSYERI